MTDAIIVGGGLFGAIIAKALRADGHEVLVIDRGERYAGSKPAACLMKPSWFSSLGRKVHVPALRLLGDLYDIKNIEFTAGIKLLKVDVMWIDPATILRPHNYNVNVVAPPDATHSPGETSASRHGLCPLA